MSVTGVTGFTDETDTASGTMSSYSLQLNTNQFSTPTACSGAKKPSAVQGRPAVPGRQQKPAYWKKLGTPY